MRRAYRMRRYMLCGPELENSECDEGCNTLQHGFDNGMCCSKEGSGEHSVSCLPWRCRDRTDTNQNGQTCQELSKNDCQDRTETWFSPDQTNSNACPLTCETCESSDQNIFKSWPYAWTFGTDNGEQTVVPTMPASFHRVLRQQQIAELEAQEGLNTSKDMKYQELLTTLPSFACPECRSYPESEKYRSIPFTVEGKPPENMFNQLDEQKPRMRFLSRPNLVLYGILMTQVYLT